MPMTDSPDQPLTDPVATYERRFSGWALAAAGVWLIFLAPAIQEGWRERGALVGWVGLVSTVAFAVFYMVSFLLARPKRSRGESLTRVTAQSLRLYLALLLLGAVMVLSLHSAGLSAAVYLSIAGVMMLPTRFAVGQAVVLAAGSELLSRTVPGWEGANGIGLSVGLGSFAVWGIWQAMRRSMDLVRAKDENAQLMIGQERARMARDLHDILGHSLTVITVKAELTGRLLEADSEEARARARAEIADIERLSRDALADVRKTVEGYRELTLPVEISRAKSALEAAEISASLPGSTDDVPTEWRELFAWTIREGVTNVVRHSAAQHCTVSLSQTSVRITDDGRGCVGADGGNGLIGLRERAAAAGARLIVELPEGGGFSLAVVVPARLVPDRLVPDRLVDDRLVPERLVDDHEQNLAENQASHASPAGQTSRAVRS